MLEELQMTSPVDRITAVLREHKPTTRRIKHPWRKGLLLNIWACTGCAWGDEETTEGQHHAHLAERVAEALPEAIVDADHLRRQRAWSRRTFGPGLRTLGITDHISRELDEIRSDPTDLAEWADVIILAFDGAWRTGAEPAEIIAAIKAKQARNEARNWPDWRTADPDKAIEHVRAPTTKEQQQP